MPDSVNRIYSFAKPDPWHYQDYWKTCFLESVGYVVRNGVLHRRFENKLDSSVYFEYDGKYTPMDWLGPKIHKTVLLHPNFQDFSETHLGTHDTGFLYV